MGVMFDLALDILAVPARVDPADAFPQRRVGCEHMPQPVLDLTEKYMGHFRRPGRVDQGAGDITADDLQRIADAVRITCILHCAGVCQKFLLAADGRLDKACSRGADQAQ